MYDVCVTYQVPLFGPHFIGRTAIVPLYPPLCHLLLRKDHLETHTHTQAVKILLLYSASYYIAAVTIESAVRDWCGASSERLERDGEKA